MLLPSNPQVLAPDVGGPLDVAVLRGHAQEGVAPAGELCGVGASHHGGAADPSVGVDLTADQHDRNRVPRRHGPPSASGADVRELGESDAGGDLSDHGGRRGAAPLQLQGGETQEPLRVGGVVARVVHSELLARRPARVEHPAPVLAAQPELRPPLVQRDEPLRGNRLHPVVHLHHQGVQRGPPAPLRCCGVEVDADPPLDEILGDQQHGCTSGDVYLNRVVPPLPRPLHRERVLVPVQ
mmetsp:Transcript_29626/g.71150  ORF Transcript_29626/g.71150 Transcript_29626/m.71150 type:complete len:239 (-) Transcript_29626:1599-2315(-)